MPTTPGGLPLPAAVRASRLGVADAYRLGVTALTAVVGAFLLLQLHAWPPHEDETLAFFVSRQPFGDLFDTVLGERGGAPLHFLLSHLVALVWPGLTGLRLLSVVFAVASVPVIAALLARLSDRKTALVATVLVATSWATLFHGIYGRMYSLFLFTSALSFLALLLALARGGWWRWAAWAVVMLAALASQPYGAAVLASQAAYVLARRARRPFPLRPAAVAFLAVAILALPLWRTYLVLASRFEVGLGDGHWALGSPLEVLEYVRSVLGDFSAGWAAAFVPFAAAALAGLASLARARPAAAVLAAAVFAAPTAGLSLVRLGGTISPETRHLIFALPFFAVLVAAGLLRAARAARQAAPAVLGLGLAALVSVQLAWGWQKTPALYADEPPERAAARHQAAAWLAATSRSDDVLFGYNPLFLEAWEDGGRLGGFVVPRADAKLALRTLLEAEKPLGRAVWVHDATNNNFTRRFEIEERSPGDAYEARVFGPFLVIRTKEPVIGARAFLRRTLQIQRLGKRLGVSDADVNFETSVRALNELLGPGWTLLYTRP